MEDSSEFPPGASFLLFALGPGSNLRGKGVLSRQCAVAQKKNLKSQCPSIFTTSSHSTIRGLREKKKRKMRTTNEVVRCRTAVALAMKFCSFSPLRLQCRLIIIIIALYYIILIPLCNNYYCYLLHRRRKHQQFLAVGVPVHTY